MTVLKTLSSVKDAPDYVKTSAKASVANTKTGDIKDDTILMSDKTTKKVIDNVSKVQKATGGGSVQYEVQNNKVVITGATVKSDNSKVAQVKVTTGKPVQAGGTGKSPVTEPAFEAPKIYSNSKGQFTNGKYTLDAKGMEIHETGSTTSGKSRSFTG